MSARISIPSRNSFIYQRVRIYTPILDPPTQYRDGDALYVFMYLESYRYYDNILRVKIGLMSSSLPHYTIPQEIPIFTSQESRFLDNYIGDVIIVSEDLDYVSTRILSRFSNHLSNIVVGEDYLTVSIKSDVHFFGMTGHATKITELTPDLYIRKSFYNEIIVSTGESVCNLDLTSTLIIDTGDYSKAFGFNTWYGVIIKQIRVCKAISSNTTVVAYGDIDENYVYLYDNEEIEDPSLALPRNFLFSKPFSGREKLEICVEPINSWVVNKTEI